MQLYLCKMIIYYSNLTIKLTDIVEKKEKKLNVLKPTIYSKPKEILIWRYGIV